jgi:hypothetical protein
MVSFPARMASVLTERAFNVASAAGNHTPGWGAEAPPDTIELLRGMGNQWEIAKLHALFLSSHQGRVARERTVCRVYIPWRLRAVCLA